MEPKEGGEQDDLPLPLFHHFKHQFHPADGYPVISGEKYEIPCLPGSANRSDLTEKKVSVKFKKLDYEYIVENIGRIANDAESCEIVRNLLSSPMLKDVTPCIIEMSNSGANAVKFDCNKFMENYKDFIGLNVKLDDALKFRWKNVLTIALQGLVVVSAIGAEIICVKLVSDWSQNNQESTDSMNTNQLFQTLQQAAINSGIHITTLSTGGLFLRRIFQRISAIKANWQVRGALAPIETPRDYLIEKGGIKSILFLIKSNMCDEFVQSLSTNNFTQYLVDAAPTNMEVEIHQ